MEKITSRDGTYIAYRRSGEGAPLVLVHGTSATSLRWMPILPALEKHFTVYAVDRRGYGESGNGASYAVEREFEDIAAVVNSIGKPANLLGHSFGALCALEGALLTQNLCKLVLYEPAIPIPGVLLYPDGIMDRFQALLDSGDREGILTVLFREVAGMPAHEFEQFRLLPAWQTRLESAHNIPRESRAEAEYAFKAERFKALRIPTLLLLGGDSPSVLKAATATIAKALPESRISVMPGQQHIAMDTAPDLFVNELVQFLLKPQ